MATFVIVHGAWSGGHAWRWLRPLLRTAGHEVFTPALTGLGERSHLASAQVDLDTHIRDVLGVLEFEDLDQVVLVGHSYGGVVITGVADRMPQRVAQLVYLDAEVPADGQCEFDLLAPGSGPATSRRPPLGGRAGRSPRRCPTRCQRVWMPGSAGRCRGWCPSPSPPSPNRCAWPTGRVRGWRVPTSGAPREKKARSFPATSSGPDLTRPGGWWSSRPGMEPT
jgi:pimeloyl-ACP methyl ester carboxylesterase